MVSSIKRILEKQHCTSVLNLANKFQLQRQWPASLLVPREVIHTEGIFVLWPEEPVMVFSPSANEMEVGMALFCLTDNIPLKTCRLN